MSEENKSQEAPTNTSSENCDSSCSSCGVSDCGERSSEPTKLEAHPDARIRHVIAVVSGKGGVGKSMVTSQLATMTRKKGYKVGVLDADITGPTMARAFGAEERLRAREDGLIPFETAEGIKVVSTNMILPQDNMPVIWRGPIISSLIQQFFAEVIWGELDYLFIDMPPGTGDATLTVFQSLPIDGIVIVTAPQDLVSMIVGKAINMAQVMQIPVLGIVENMAYFKCPNCNSTHEIFGKSTIEALADEYGIALSSSLPLDSSFAGYMDKGQVGNIELPELQDFVDKVLATEEMRDKLRQGA